MSKPCQIRVLSSGKYCCEADQMYVDDNCIGSLKFANLPEVAVEYEITPDVWVPAEVPTISGTGMEALCTPGLYRFVIDCEVLNGTVAPEEDAISFCYECCPIEEYGALMFACLKEIKALLVASDDTMAIMQIISQLQEICTKLLSLISTLEDVAESLTTLTTQLETVLTALENLCTKIEDGFEAMLECFEDMKETLVSIESESVQTNENLEQIIKLLTCPPATAEGLKTSWG